MSLNILNIALSANKEIFWHNFFSEFFSSGCTSILRIGVIIQRRQKVASTLIGRCLNVMCPLGTVKLYLAVFKYFRKNNLKF